MLSNKTQQPVTLSELTHGQRVFRERLSRPDFQARVLVGDTASLFPEHVVETGMRIAQLTETSAVPDVVPSVKWETDHTGVWQEGLRGKAFLFPGTGSLAWPRLSAILASEAFVKSWQRSTGWYGKSRLWHPSSRRLQIGRGIRAACSQLLRHRSDLQLPGERPLRGAAR